LISDVLIGPGVVGATGQLGGTAVGQDHEGERCLT
jgi:hypothetical protein